MIWLGILGVIACFAVLIFAAYKKISMVFMAPVAAIIIAVTNGLDVAEVLSGVYSEGMVGFIKAWFLVIALGSLFGQLYNDSGAAWRIGDTLVSWAGPKWALTMYILLGGLLVYGGINIIVVIFVL
ncbi:MAG: GntP family permease, partial [bacterium]